MQRAHTHFHAISSFIFFHRFCSCVLNLHYETMRRANMVQKVKHVSLRSKCCTFFCLHREFFACLLCQNCSFHLLGNIIISCTVLLAEIYLFVLFELKIKNFFSAEASIIHKIKFNNSRINFFTRTHVNVFLLSFNTSFTGCDRQRFLPSDEHLEFIVCYYCYCLYYTKISHSHFPGKGKHVFE